MPVRILSQELATASGGYKAAGALTLLLEMKNAMDTLETSTTISHKVNHASMPRPSNSASRYLPEVQQNMHNS
jgi:hypothetical protein